MITSLCSRLSFSIPLRVSSLTHQLSSEAREQQINNRSWTLMASLIPSRMRSPGTKLRSSSQQRMPRPCKHSYSARAKDLSACECEINAEYQRIGLPRSVRKNSIHSSRVPQDLRKDSILDSWTESSMAEAVIANVSTPTSHGP